MLTPSITTFLVTLVNIGILFLVLRALLFKPVSKFMAERTKKIGDSIAKAEKDKAQAKLLLSQYEDQLKHAEAEAEAIIRAARETAQQQSDRAALEAKQNAELFMANARKQMEAEQKASLALFKAQAAGLVIAACSRLLKRDFKAEDDKQYAEMILRELKGQ
jgi:F-type H+-transporting ATPase subunit b